MLLPPRYRRVLFYALAVLFLILAPLLILYASGYRFDKERFTIQGTGVLSLTTSPSVVSVQLGERVESLKTPTRLSGVLPGRYDVTIRKDAYHPWVKQLWFSASETTFAEHVLLWLREPIVDAITTDADSVAWSDSFIAFVDDTGDAPSLAVVSADTGRAERVRLPSTLSDVVITLGAWSRNGERLLVRINGVDAQLRSRAEHYIIATRDGIMVTPLASIVGTAPLTHPSWDTRNDHILHAFIPDVTVSGANKLIEIDLFRGGVRDTALTGVTVLPQYIVHDSLLYKTLIDEKGVAQLVITPLFEDERALERRIPIALGDEIEIVAGGPDHTLTIYDEGAQVLHILDTQTRTLYPILESFPRVTTAAWSPDGQTLALAEEKQLSLYNIRQASHKVARDASAPIAHIAWHQSGDYMFYSSPDGLAVLEHDERGERNHTQIISSPTTFFSIDRRGQRVFIETKIRGDARSDIDWAIITE